MIGLFVIGAALVLFITAMPSRSRVPVAELPESTLGEALAKAARGNNARVLLDENPAIVERDGIRIEVTLGGVTWRVAVPPPGTIRYRLYADGLATFTNHQFGSLELPSSTLPALGGQFLIVADDEAMLRAVWTDEHCRLLLQEFRGIEIASDGMQIDISIGTRCELSTLDAGIRLLFGLASVDLHGFAELQRALPDGHFDRGGGYVELPGPGGVRVGLERTESIHTYARGDAGDLAEISDEVRQRVAELGAASIGLSDGEVVVHWPRIERNPQRLTSCVELLRSLVTAPSDGVFR